MKNNILKIVLALVSLGLVWLLFNSLNGPIEFEKIKNERYVSTVKKMLVLKDAEKAYKDVNGRYTGDYDTLFTFVETGKFPIVFERDTAYMKYDPNYRIERLFETTLRDTVRYVSVKDSLFKGIDLRDSKYVPFTEPKKEFKLQTAMIGDSAAKYSVYQVTADKTDVLIDLDEDLTVVELRTKVPVSGEKFKLGSLYELKENGNWNKDLENAARGK